MKRVSFFLAAALLVSPAIVRAQDAATEERLNKLSAQIQDLYDAKEAQNRQVEELKRSVQSLQQQVNKPSGNYASAEDVKHLADKLQEVDRKRIEDNERIAATLKDLGKTIKVASAAPVKPAPAPEQPSDVPSKGFEYTICSGDTLSTIAKAYRDKDVKVSVDQIVAANPGLDPAKMRIGQTIFIPKPKN
jgi:LysM repeat protein